MSLTTEREEVGAAKNQGDRQDADRGDIQRHRRQIWRGLLTPGGLLLLLLFIAPLILLGVFSFGTTDIVGRPQLGFSLQSYAQVFEAYNLPVLGRTLWYAVAATSLCLIIGYAVAYTASQFAGRYGLAIIVMMVAPWLVGYLVRIYAWKQLLGDEGWVNAGLGVLGIDAIGWLGSGVAVIVGLVYSYLPLMVLPLYAALGDLDKSAIDAGKDLYGGPASTFWHVTLPSTRSGIIGGCLLVFLPALGDFVTAQFLGGPQTTMVGNVIADQFLTSGSRTFGSALSLTLIATLVVALLVVRAAASRQRESLADMLEQS